MSFRLRDLPAYPILALLHLLFTITSLIVRIGESLISSRTLARAAKPPGHIALVLSDRSDVETTRSTRTKRDENAGERRAVVESIRRVVEWADYAGTNEVSVWDSHGLIQRYRQDILNEVLRLPPSPPSSGASTPTRRKGSAPPAQLGHPTTRSHDSTFTVYPSSKPVTLHLLPPSSSSSSSVVVDITRQYAADHTAPASITARTLDTDVRLALGFYTDPDLLIIHHLSPPSFFRALLPRPPPELDGYPFWPLRITEIYQHPTALPIPQSLIQCMSMVLARAQNSSLPLARKTARLIPPAGSDTEGVFVPGAVTGKEWEGAMQAWSQVEQRLGK